MFKINKKINSYLLPKKLVSSSGIKSVLKKVHFSNKVTDTLALSTAAMASTIVAKNKVMDEDFQKKSQLSEVMGAVTGILVKKNDRGDDDNKEKIKDLTDAEFIAMKEDILKSVPRNVRFFYKMLEDHQVNKYNIQLMKKMFSDEKLYYNESLGNSFNISIVDTDNRKLAQQKLDIINKYLDETVLNQNPNVIQHLGIILSDLNDQNSPKSQLLLKIFKDSNFYANPKLMTHIFSIMAKASLIDNAYGNANAYQHYDVINQILDNQFLSHNDKFLSEFNKAISDVFVVSGIEKNVHAVKERVQTLQDKFTDKKVYQNGNQARLQILDRFINDERVYKNRDLVNNFSEIIKTTYTMKSAQAKLLVLDSFLDSNIQSNDAKFIDQVLVILPTISKMEQATILSKILHDRKLLDNEELMLNLMDIMTQVYNDNTQEIVENFLDDEELYNNPTLVANLSTILGYCDKQNGYELAKDVLFNKENRNILLKFQQDAIDNRTLLKTGIKDLYDDEILSDTASYNTVKTLFLLGDKTLKSAFSMTITGFNEICKEIAMMNLDNENQDLLLSKINPEKSMKYQSLRKDATNLKLKLWKQLTAEDLLKIQELSAKKTKIDTQKNIISKKFKNIDKNDELAIKLHAQYRELNNVSKQLGHEIQYIYLSGKNADACKKIMQEISKKTKEANQMLEFASKISPQDIIDKVRVISAISCSYRSEIVNMFIKLISPSDSMNDIPWNESVHQLIYDRMQVGYDSTVVKKLDLVHCKYLSKMFISSEEFFYNMGTLVKRVKENSSQSLEKIFDELPQNIETKKIYEDYGINYEKWTKFDPQSFVKITTIEKVAEAKHKIVERIKRDFNDGTFELLPNNIQDDIEDQLEKYGIYLDKKITELDEGMVEQILLLDDMKDFTDRIYKVQYRIHKDGKEITFDDVPKILSAIKKAISANEFWTTEQSDVDVDDVRLELYERFIKILPAKLESIKNMKNDTNANIMVRKVNMYDVKDALTLGNNAKCCTALGKNMKEYTAPNYIMNKCVGSMEILDNGKPVGNAMMFFALVDGNLALFIDDIELKTAYKDNDQIRDAIVEYAQKLCVEVGRANLPIYAGLNRHNVDMSIFTKGKHQVEVIGSTGTDDVYLDFDADRHIVGNEKPSENILYKIS